MENGVPELVPGGRALPYFPAQDKAHFPEKRKSGFLFILLV
jgi:hypothetical protein